MRALTSAGGELETEVLVLGAGVAGLSAAIEARRAGRRVCVVCKGRAGRGGNSLVAAGQLSGVHQGGGDDVWSFARDTLAGGREIGSPELVAVLARGSREVVPFLESCGSVFVRRDGALVLGRNPGHSRRRTASAAPPGRPASAAGLGLTLPLLGEALRLGVSFQEEATALRIESRDGRVEGAVGLGSAGAFLVRAGAVVLACGGGARLYAHTNNAVDVTGDGVALAYEAGAELRDLEFVQFHPTMGLRPLRAVFPTTLFGEGAVLRNRAGERFVSRSVSGGEAAATRDAMSRAILAEVREGRGVGGGVVLDLSGVSPEALAERCGGLAAALARRGGGAEPLVVGPCAHFLMGGVTIGADAATTAPGVFAAGEVAGGVHGANRLGGNALTEAVVFGRIAGASAARAASASSPRLEGVDLPRGWVDGPALGEVVRELRALTWGCAGLVRSGEELTQGLRGLEELRLRADRLPSGAQSRRGAEGRSLFLLSRLILEAALLRSESRGAHWRSDFPSSEDELGRKSLRVRRGPDAEPAFHWAGVT